VSTVKTGSRPYALIIGNFREPTQTSLASPHNQDDVYLAIALNTLDAETGILNFFPRDGALRTLGQAEVLEPGDGIICRGECSNPAGGGEGGIVLMIHYQVETGQ
jgi:hypothetical protein